MGAERRSPSAAAVSAAADSPPVQSVAVDLRRAVRIGVKLLNEFVKRGEREYD